MNRKRTTARRSETPERLAEAAAGTFLGDVITYEDLVERAYPSVRALADHLARTKYRSVDDAREREAEAEQEAAFRIGLAIGRQMAGCGGVR